MSARNEIADNDVTEIVQHTLTTATAMCAELHKYGLPVTARVFKIISDSLASSLIANKFGRMPSNHLH